MADVPDEATKLAITYGVTIFKTLSAHQQNIAEMMIATSAMLLAVGEQSPHLAESYERHRAASEGTSPLVAQSRAITAQLDGIVKRLEGLK